MAGAAFGAAGFAVLEVAGVVALRIGIVEGDNIVVESPADVRIPLSDLRAAHESFFKNWMES